MALIQPIGLQPLNVKIVVSLKLNLVGKIYINEKYSKKYWDKKIFRMVKNSKGKTNSNKIVWVNIFWTTRIMAWVKQATIKKIDIRNN